MQEPIEVKVDFNALREMRGLYMNSFQNLSILHEARSAKPTLKGNCRSNIYTLRNPEDVQTLLKGLVEEKGHDIPLKNARLMSEVENPPKTDAESVENGAIRLHTLVEAADCLDMKTVGVLAKFWGNEAQNAAFDEIQNDGARDPFGRFLVKSEDIVEEIKAARKEHDYGL